MKKNITKIIKILGESNIVLNEPLNKYCSMHVGGAAQIFYKAKNRNDLVKVVLLVRKVRVPYIVIGSGTNCLFTDNGFVGLVIKNESSTIKLIGVRGNRINYKKQTFPASKVYLEVDSGVNINRLVRYTLDQGYKGLEYFLGQPGTVGGAVFINAHNIFYNSYFSDNIVSVKILKSKGLVVTEAKNYFQFAYDQSIIQKSGEIVLSVVFEFPVSDKQLLWQEAVKAQQYRIKTQPQGVYSSGCTFRNIAISDAIRLATPNYSCSAGFIIERLGLKGTKIGQAQFSQNHANFITNNGKAKASDVLELITLAQKKAKEKYNLDLKEEVIIFQN